MLVAGPQPFRLNSSGGLQLSLAPILPEWLFTKNEGAHSYWDQTTGWEEIYIPSNSFAFRFLGQTLVIYHNPGRKPTFGSNAATISGCTFTYRNGKVQSEDGGVFSDLHARAVRSGEMQRMDVVMV